MTSGRHEPGRSFAGKGLLSNLQRRLLRLKRTLVTSRAHSPVLQIERVRSAQHPTVTPPNVVEPETVSLPGGASPETLTLIGTREIVARDGDCPGLGAEAEGLEPDRHRQRVAWPDGDRVGQDFWREEIGCAGRNPGNGKLALAAVGHDQRFIGKRADADVAEASPIRDDQVRLGRCKDPGNGDHVGPGRVVAGDDDRAGLRTIGSRRLEADDHIDRIAGIDKKGVSKHAWREEVRGSGDVEDPKRASPGVVDGEQFVGQRAEADVSEAAGIGDRRRDLGWFPGWLSS